MTVFVLFHDRDFIGIYATRVGANESIEKFLEMDPSVPSDQYRVEEVAVNP